VAAHLPKSKRTIYMGFPYVGLVVNQTDGAVNPRKDQYEALTRYR